MLYFLHKNVGFRLREKFYLRKRWLILHLPYYAKTCFRYILKASWIRVFVNVVSPIWFPQSPVLSWWHFEDYRSWLFSAFIFCGRRLKFEIVSSSAQVQWGIIYCIHLKRVLQHFPALARNLFILNSVFHEKFPLSGSLSSAWYTCSPLKALKRLYFLILRPSTFPTDLWVLKKLCLDFSDFPVVICPKRRCLSAFFGLHFSIRVQVSFRVHEEMMHTSVYNLLSFVNLFHRVTFGQVSVIVLSFFGRDSNGTRLSRHILLYKNWGLMPRSADRFGLLPTKLISDSAGCSTQILTVGCCYSDLYVSTSCRGLRPSTLGLAYVPGVRLHFKLISFACVPVYF